MGIPLRQGLEHEVGERFVDAGRGGDGLLSGVLWGSSRGAAGGHPGVAGVKLPVPLHGSGCCGVLLCTVGSVRAAHGCEREMGKILFWPRCARFLHPFLQPSPGPFPFFHARCCRSTSSCSAPRCLQRLLQCRERGSLLRAPSLALWGLLVAVPKPHCSVP